MPPPKTNAERQREYRERKKAREGEKYMRKERCRKRRAYIPTSELSTKELKQRRKTIRESMRKARRNEREKRQAEHADRPTSIESPDSTAPDNRHLIVALPFRSPDRAAVARRRRLSRAVSRTKRKLERVEQQLQKKEKACRSLRKRLQRVTNQKGTHSQSTPVTKPSANSTCMTPRSQAKKDMRAVGLSPRKLPTIRKKLALHNALLSDLKESAPRLDKKDRKVLRKVISGHQVCRNRGLSSLTSFAGMRKRETVKKHVKTAWSVRLKERVRDFYHRDDVSTCLPGKKDAQKTGKVSKQRRVLSDYLSNLFKRYQSENPSSHLKFAMFCRLRPSYIVLVSFKTRDTCLCQKHQNIALKLKALQTLQREKITSGSTVNLVPDSPDELVREFDSEEKITEIFEGLPRSDGNYVCFEEWQRVCTTYNGKDIRRTKLMQRKVSLMEFQTIFIKEVAVFRKHVERVVAQHQAVRKLKEDLSETQVIIQMDFAENYTCSYNHEVQSAYFGKTSVTLHPVVIYTRSTCNPAVLLHKSVVFVSDVLNHNSSTVLAIIHQLVPLVKEVIPSLSGIHYVTDSPTSQYRNKDMFFVVGNHEAMFQGVSATWTYFEAGHGKGPCDGVGGTIKRMADASVTQGKTRIQDAQDFLTWAKSREESSDISAEFVKREGCEKATAFLRKVAPRGVPGTMKVHAVVCTEAGTVTVRETSCFNDDCWTGTKLAEKPGCSGWTKHQVGTIPAVSNAESLGNQAQLQALSQPDEQPGVSEDQGDLEIVDNIAIPDVIAELLPTEEGSSTTASDVNATKRGRKRPQQRKKAEAPDKKSRAGRGRKQSQPQGSGTKSQDLTEDDVLCGACNMAYSESEQHMQWWIQCLKCRGWFHEVCLGFSGEEKAPKNFVCSTYKCVN